MDSELSAPCMPRTSDFTSSEIPTTWTMYDQTTQWYREALVTPPPGPKPNNLTGSKRRRAKYDRANQCTLEDLFTPPTCPKPENLTGSKRRTNKYDRANQCTLENLFTPPACQATEPEALEPRSKKTLRKKARKAARQQQTASEQKAAPHLEASPIQGPDLMIGNLDLNAESTELDVEDDEKRSDTGDQTRDGSWETLLNAVGQIEFALSSYSASGAVTSKESLLEANTILVEHWGVRRVSFLSGKNLNWVIEEIGSVVAAIRMALAGPQANIAGVLQYLFAQLYKYDDIFLFCWKNVNCVPATEDEENERMSYIAIDAPTDIVTVEYPVVTVTLKAPADISTVESPVNNTSFMAKAEDIAAECPVDNTTFMTEAGDITAESPVDNSSFLAPGYSLAEEATANTRLKDRIDSMEVLLDEAVTRIERQARDIAALRKDKRFIRKAVSELRTGNEPIDMGEGGTGTCIIM